MNYQRGVSLMPLLWLLLIGCTAAYFIWPAGVTDQPLGSMTFGVLLRVLGAGVVVFVAVYVGAMLSDWD